MLRVVGQTVAGRMRQMLCSVRPVALTVPVRGAHGPEESEDDFNRRYVEYFMRGDIDGWEIRQAMNNIMGMDLIPDPTVIEAGLRACRKVNDIALAIRWIEGCKEKCGHLVKTHYPYLMEHVAPVMKELGVPTLEELSYDSPQLALKSVYDTD